MAILSRQRSSAIPLALAYAALVLYASLYPFEDWRWPPGQAAASLLMLPWTRWLGPFDIASNLLGYLPLGALLFFALRRSGGGTAASWLFALFVAAALSWSTEVLQQFLPRRVPALEDWLMNTAGAAAGALLALLLQASGMVERWQALRERWFDRDSAAALALLALWPVGLLFPAPLPLGMGQVGERLREWVAELTADVPWATAVHEVMAIPAPPTVPLRPLTEMLLVALGLLAPCVVAFVVMRPGWRRGAMAFGALLLAAAGMGLSTLLNFGPAHATAWLTPASGTGLAMGMVFAALLWPLPRRLVAGVGLMGLTALLVGVAQAPSDPYFAQSLQAWEQGRFVRFHGLAQWVGWLWPYAALLWLLSRLARGPQVGMRQAGG